VAPDWNHWPTLNGTTSLRDLEWVAILNGIRNQAGVGGSWGLTPQSEGTTFASCSSWPCIQTRQALEFLVDLYAIETAFEVKASCGQALPLRPVPPESFLRSVAGTPIMAVRTAIKPALDYFSL